MSGSELEPVVFDTERLTSGIAAGGQSASEAQPIVDYTDLLTGAILARGNVRFQA